MKTITLSRPVFWGLVLLLGLAVLLPAQELPAQDTACFAVDRYDLPRDCTFLEEHGACLWNALDSYETCRDDAHGFLETVGCDIGVQVDLLACNFGLPLRLLRAILD